MLYITANDNKLQSYIMLNRKTVTEENFCEEIIVWAQENAWMMAELMEHRLGCVWECLPGGLSKPWSSLAIDVFRGHLSDRIRNKLRYKNTDLLIIPSGMTSQLQSFDMSKNKPFKHHVHKHYNKKHCCVWWF
jgi:hypothetical protein